MVASTIRLTTPDSLRAGLEEIRRRRRLLWIVFWTYVPVMVLLFKLLGGWVFPWAAFAWMGLLGVTGIRVSLSRCPRCGERFHWSLAWHNAWARKCLHCGLPLRPKDAELVAP
jgi:hypothetical protein